VISSQGRSVCNIECRASTHRVLKSGVESKHPNLVLCKDRESFKVELGVTQLNSEVVGCRVMDVSVPK
jgi:hypothetical protein